MECWLIIFLQEKVFIFRFAILQIVDIKILMRAALKSLYLITAALA